MNRRRGIRGTASAEPDEEFVGSDVIQGHGSSDPGLACARSEVSNSKAPLPGKTARSSRFSYPSRGNRLGRKGYIFFVAVTGLLAVAQMLLLPRSLGAQQFGMLALAMSLTQAVQQFGDMGFGNAAARLDLDDSTRATYREYAVSVNALLSLAAVGALGLLVALSSLDPGTAGTLALAVLAGAVLATSKMRASATVQSGDEKRASFENAVWQNAPKPGMLLGALGGLAITASLGSVVTAVLLGRPLLPRRLPTLRAIAAASRYWVSGLVLVLAAFVATWLDTYVLTALMGLGAAGEYQAIVRPLIGVTYLYLPILGLIQSAANRHDRERVKTLVCVSLVVASVAAACVAAVLTGLGEEFWPGYQFPAEVVVVSAIAVVAMCASAVFGTQLLVQGRQLHTAAATLLGAGVLCIATVSLVPHIGLLGAAAGSAAGWTVSAVTQYCCSHPRAAGTGARSQYGKELKSS